MQPIPSISFRVAKPSDEINPKTPCSFCGLSNWYIKNPDSSHIEGNSFGITACIFTHPNGSIFVVHLMEVLLSVEYGLELEERRITLENRIENLPSRYQNGFSLIDFLLNRLFPYNIKLSIESLLEKNIDILSCREASSFFYTIKAEASYQSSSRKRGRSSSLSLRSPTTQSKNKRSRSSSSSSTATPSYHETSQSSASSLTNNLLYIEPLERSSSSSSTATPSYHETSQSSASSLTNNPLCIEPLERSSSSSSAATPSHHETSQSSSRPSNVLPSYVDEQFSYSVYIKDGQTVLFIRVGRLQVIFPIQNLLGLISKESLIYEIKRRDSPCLSRPDTDFFKRKKKKNSNESVAESVAEPVAEPVAESVAEPVAEPASKYFPSNEEIPSNLYDCELESPISLPDIPSSYFLNSSPRSINEYAHQFSISVIKKEINVQTFHRGPLSFNEISNRTKKTKKVEKEHLVVSLNDQKKEIDIHYILISTPIDFLAAELSWRESQLG